jgi:hypothetical protein
MRFSSDINYQIRRVPLYDIYRAVLHLDVILTVSAVETECILVLEKVCGNAEICWNMHESRPILTHILSAKSSVVCVFSSWYFPVEDAGQMVT